jgi:hypothetical protein
MINEPPSGLSAYLTKLLASGQVVFRASEAQEALGIGQGAFLDAAEKLQKKKALFAPRQGFYVVVPPQYLSLGCPPPAWFIGDLMRHEDRPYYVGLLKAAEIHGAAHHAVMEFQIVTTKQLRPIKAGRTRITFTFRKDFAAITPGIETHKTETGTMNVSSPELTLLDLFRYPQAAGGLDTILPVLDELAPKIMPEKLNELAGGFERSVLQRAGFLLERSGHVSLADALYDRVGGQSLSFIELDRRLIRDPDLTPPVIEQNKRWRVIVRKMPEHDQ